MDPSANVCTADIRATFASNTTICNWMLAALTIGYATFGTVGGLLISPTVGASTRVVAFLGGSVIASSFFITSFYTSNIYIMMFCSFGVLYGAGIGLMWRYPIFSSFVSLCSVYLYFCYVFCDALSPAISCVMRWFPQSKALMSGALLSAVTIGSICLSIIETEVCYMFIDELEFWFK